MMPNVLVRDVEEGILQKLKELAAANGRSLQNELQLVFRSLAESDSLSDEQTAAHIKDSLRGGREFSDSALLLREDRSR